MINHNEANEIHAEKRKALCDFFDKNFTVDEIMVLKAVMYFGRYCYTCENSNEYKGTAEDVILTWLNFFSYDLDSKRNKVDKGIEIGQIVSKGIQVGNYFETGFEELKKRPQSNILKI